MYVSQVIMLHTLNLYSAVCQLYLNIQLKEKNYPRTRKKEMYVCSLDVISPYIISMLKMSYLVISKTLNLRLYDVILKL